MRSVKYGDRVIEYVIVEDERLAAHYITVEKNKPVMLRGRAVAGEQADRMVLKKARWILDKLSLLHPSNGSAPGSGIVTGSRILYLGRHYYTEVVYSAQAGELVELTFNYSRFRIVVGAVADVQLAIREALEAFYLKKAEEKMIPRVRQWSRKTGLLYRDIKFRPMEKRWAACTAADVLLINPGVMKLPFSLIDYVIVHELCHTRVKNHSREFWAEVARHLPEWKVLDERLGRVNDQ